MNYTEIFLSFCCVCVCLFQVFTYVCSCVKMIRSENTDHKIGIKEKHGMF